MEYYSAVNKEEEGGGGGGNITFCDSIDGPGECYAKQNVSQRKTSTIWSYMESNEQNKMMSKIGTDS